LGQRKIHGSRRGTWTTAPRWFKHSTQNSQTQQQGTRGDGKRSEGKPFPTGFFNSAPGKDAEPKEEDQIFFSDLNKRGRLGHQKGDSVMTMLATCHRQSPYSFTQGRTLLFSHLAILIIVLKILEPAFLSHKPGLNINNLKAIEDYTMEDLQDQLLLCLSYANIIRSIFVENGDGTWEGNEATYNRNVIQNFAQNFQKNFEG
jgi:hypothetical protein